MVGVPHCDNGFITLLWQDRVGGLQVQTPDGDWEDVAPRDNALVVNFGRLLSDWSGGRIQATEHRIVGGTRSRHSIPFFFEPAVEATIEAPNAEATAGMSTATGYGSACRPSSSSRGWNAPRRTTDTESAPPDVPRRPNDATTTSPP